MLIMMIMIIMSTMIIRMMLYSTFALPCDPYLDPELLALHTTSAYL